MPLDSFACPDQEQVTGQKLTKKFHRKKYYKLFQFSAKAHIVCAKLLKQLPKSPFSFAKPQPQLHEDVNQAVTYVRRIPRTL